MGSSSLDGQQRTHGTAHYYSGTHQSETTGMGEHGMFPSHEAGSVPLGVYAVQGENAFPERPDQPECQFYMKTGDCKFGAVCKFNHPKERMIPAPNCALSPLGLPLRPVRFVFHQNDMHPAECITSIPFIGFFSLNFCCLFLCFGY